MWMHEHCMWGFWWVFPLLGIVFLVVLIFLLIRAFGGGSFSGHSKVIEELKREMRDLKEEIERLKKDES